jgi:pyruvate ferredoxin oxidoreductase beta subunit/2-oxoisovalerate ferredoxin oxidoreductase beta subunit
MINPDLTEFSELLHPGHAFCAGCGFILSFRHLLKELGQDTIVAITAGCLVTNSGYYPASPIKLAGYNTPFASVAAAATGIRAALEAKGNRTTQVLAVGGDGGTYDIGFQALSAAAERNEDFIYLCYDNEGYMNTGVQRSSATPSGALTTTTPEGKDTPKKNLPAIMMEHGIPYLATATPAYSEDFLAKIRKMKNIKGFRYLHVLAPCPPGWGIPSQSMIRLARLAVESRVFPLFEVEGGRKIVINADPERIPVERYLAGQSRFKSLSREGIVSLQKQVDFNWAALKARLDWLNNLQEGEE